MSRQESDNFIEEARLLLPWYLTNTLSDEEQELVNKALEASPELRKEFVREEKMMRLVKENTSLLELSALDTTEQRLENTLARIEREEQQQESKLAEKADIISKEPAKQGGWFKRLFEHKLFDIEWLTPANAAFASLLAFQVGVLGYYQLAGDETEYHSVTVEQSPLPANAGEENLKKLFLMEFQTSAQHGEVCDFLNNWNARIVSGPNSHNMFTVEMKTDAHTDAAAFAETIMSQASQADVPVVFIGPQFQAK